MFSSTKYLTPQTGGGESVIFPYHYTTIVAGTWVFAANAAQWASFTFYNSSAAQNDALDFKVFLSAGTYTLIDLSLKNANLGICTYKIDGASIGTIDYYAGAQTDNSIQRITGITVATSGIHTLTAIMATKNGLSSAYARVNMCVRLVRTV